MGKVLVVGSSVVDLTFYTDRIPGIGETVMGRFVQGLGGKGFNQAVGSALSGASTAFLSATGPMETDAFAPLFRKRLQETGIAHALETIESESTGAAAISVDKEGRNNIIVSLGANGKLSPEFLERNLTFFENVDALVLQFETNFPVIDHALRLVRLHSPKAIAILNPAPALPDIPASILKEVDLFTPNETELELISGVKIRSDDDLQNACRKVQGPKAILATLGERGCFHFRNGSGKLYPAFKVKALDTSGAGDAFNGGLASGLVRFQGDLGAAIRFASAVAAISVTRPGTSASMPKLEEVLEFLGLPPPREKKAPSPAVALDRSPYPAHWFSPVPEDGVPDWEILPQAAGPGEVILSKRNELGLLSNFAPTPFTFRGRRYNSLEGFWQMMFYPESPEEERSKASGIHWPHTREEVSRMVGHEAFAAGVAGYQNMRAMGINYVTLDGRRYEYWTQLRNEHFGLIKEAMWEKLRQNQKVREVLLSTGDLILRADHHEPEDAPPSWQYYKIWMEIREQLKKEASAS